MWNQRSRHASAVFLGRAEISGCERERIVRPHDKFAGCVVRHVIILIIDHAGLEALKDRAHQSGLLVLYGRAQHKIGFRRAPAVEQADPGASREFLVKLRRDTRRERDPHRMRASLPAKPAARAGSAPWRRADR